ncbi:O-antigen ligase family protein [Roseiconus nitratireducens]|uniref:O-antigen ligase family protein n=1 Tax=Roseiconus nitratireducens TaxID=2605748 RepID=A0A5M6D8F4_9BACT|nr:O-antigen ligase family protein [Roseiconus nitratireducens]KAA5543811.1 O-antigen ligase family protein [Roseiconus nitratireducens]
MNRAIVGQTLLWCAAVTIGLTPGVLATDFGGILPWSQYVGSLALVFACLLTLLGIGVSVGTTPTATPSRFAYIVGGVLAVAAGYGWLQTCAVPASWVGLFSPASYLAYVQWAGSLIGITADSSIPISISPADSLDSVAWLAIVAVASTFATVLYRDRHRAAGLLWMILAGGTSIALIGIFRKWIPDFTLWSFQAGGEGAPFGTFLNRNNAALGINLGLAAAIGLSAWRWEIFRSTVVGPGRPMGAPSRLAKRWFSDPMSAIATAAVLTGLAGVAICGSRGGLLSAVVAGTVVGLTFAKRSRLRDVIAPNVVARAKAAAVAGSIVLAAVILLRPGSGDPSQPPPTAGTIESAFQAGTQRLSADYRLAHWPDGLRTAAKHFPAGSGYSTYRFAYLPWQQTSPWRWCVHADNLWLEWLVEGGVVAALLLAFLLWQSVQMIRRLSRSPDPFDYGLSLSVLYALTVIGVSQCFDFGLAMPANFLGAALLFTGGFTRAAQVVVSTSTSRGGKLKLRHADEQAWKSTTFWRQGMVPSAIGVCLLAASLIALTRLRLNSRIDFAVKSTELRFDAIKSAPEQLNGQIEELQTLAKEQSRPELLDLLARCEFQRGRLQELIAHQNATNTASLARQYAESSRNLRRLAWRRSVPELAGEAERSPVEVVAKGFDDGAHQATSPYARSLARSKESLFARPMGLSPRMNLVFTEFVHQTPSVTDEALQQSAQLFRNNAELQFRLGTQAADHGGYVLATEMWRRAATIDATMVRRVLARAARYDVFPIQKVIPGSAAPKATVDRYLVDGHSNQRSDPNARAAKSDTEHSVNPTRWNSSH